MKVDVFFSNNLEDCTNAVIKNIDMTKDISQENIIICPDSFSLLVEKKVFKQLEIDCTFNIKVLGISKLFNSLKIQTDLKPLTTFESELIIRKILLGNSGNFKSFKNSTISFSLCDEIYKTIAQLKANKIRPERLEKYYPEKENSLSLKLCDLKLIYEKYEQEILGKYLDSNDVLTQIEKAIGQNQKVKNNDYYFVGFDSLTKQGFSILDALVRNSNRVVVGIMIPSEQQNAYLYEYDMVEKLKNICNQNGCVVDFCSADNGLNANQNHIVNNLLSLKPDKKEIEDYFSLTEFSNQTTEIEEISRKIFDMVQNGKRYKQIQLAVCDLEKYKESIEIIFSKKNIPFFIDLKEKFCEISVVSYVVNIIKMINNNFDIDNVKSFVQNQYTGIDRQTKNEISNHIDYYKYDGDSFLDDEYFMTSNNEIFLRYIKFFKSIKTQLESENNVQKYISIIKQIFDVFEIENKINEKIALFQKKNDIKSEKIFNQVMQKFETAFASLTKISANENMTFDCFVDLLEQLFSILEISTIPISVDCVFVGDMTSSFFEQKDVIFVVGANEGKCPFYSSDCGIISDNDIEELKKNFEVEPSIKMINRRNRFKVFQNFSVAKQNLFVSFISQGEDGKKSLPSSFATGFFNIFSSKNNMNISYVEEVAHKRETQEFMLHSCQTESDIKYQYALLKKQNEESYKKLEMFLKDIKTIFVEKSNSFENIENAKDLFLPNDKAKITQIQNYFRCPFKHYVENGLKIREKKDSKISSIDFGNIVHKCLELYGKKHKEKLGYLDEEEITKIANEIFAIVINSDDFVVFATCKDNKEALFQLKKEIENIFSEINRQQKYSALKVFECEYVFKEEVELNFGGLKIVFSGVVDRIDCDEESFKIIDYKTGTIHSELKLIYHGIDLQVLLYSEIIANKLKLKPVGSFYFPICDDYVQKDNEKKKYLKGYFIAEEEYVKKLDNRLSLENPQSDIYNIKIKTSKDNIKENKFEVAKSMESFTEKGYKDLCALTIKTIEQAIKEIRQGNICPSPLENECEYCPYYATCNLSLNKKRGYVLSSKDVTEEFVAKILEEKIKE